VGRWLTGARVSAGGVGASPGRRRGVAGMGRVAAGCRERGTSVGRWGGAAGWSGAARGGLERPGAAWSVGEAGFGSAAGGGRGACVGRVDPARAAGPGRPPPVRRRSTGRRGGRSKPVIIPRRETGSAPPRGRRRGQGLTVVFHGGSPGRILDTGERADYLARPLVGTCGAGAWTPVRRFGGQTSRIGSSVAQW
jgi:hypothetical protein